MWPIFHHITYIIILIGEKPYQCCHCDHVFLWIEGLLNYQKVHTKNRPYQFIQCAIVFLRDSNLKIHHQIHTWVKPCQYNQCEKTLNEIHFYNLFNKLFLYLAGYNTIYKLKLNAPISFLSSIQKAEELIKAATVRAWELQHVSTVHCPQCCVPLQVWRWKYGFFSSLMSYL